VSRRSSFRIITTSCRRCGQPVATGNRSLYGLDALKAQYDRICEACITSAEQADMLDCMGRGVAIFVRK
jgi:hypothetical protein